RFIASHVDGVGACDRYGGTEPGEQLLFVNVERVPWYANARPGRALQGNIGERSVVNNAGNAVLLPNVPGRRTGRKFKRANSSRLGNHYQAVDHNGMVTERFIVSLGHSQFRKTERMFGGPVGRHGRG